MRELPLFLAAVGKRWWALMSCAIFTLIGLYAASAVRTMIGLFALRSVRRSFAYSSRASLLG